MSARAAGWAIVAILAAFGGVAFVFSEFLLVRDTRQYALEAFWYVSEHVRHAGSFPSWAPMGAGVPMALLSNAFLVLVPWHLPAYLAAALVDVPVVAAYRLSLFVGFAGLLAMSYGFFREVFQQRALGVFVTLLAAFSGLTFGNFHQEQALASVFWIPLILLLLLRGSRTDRPRDVICAAGLLGAACCLHYPQIPVLSVATVVLAFAVTGNVRRLIPASIRPRHAAAALGLFALSTMPVLVAATQVREFSSPFRKTASVAVTTYAEYVAMNTQTKSSAPFDHFRYYLDLPRNGLLGFDNFAFHLGKLPAIAALAAIVFAERATRPFAVTAAGLALLTLGINAGAATLLFAVGGPFIAMFRQWYHHQVILNLTMFVLAGFGLRALVEGTVSRARLVTCCIVAIVAGVAGIALDPWPSTALTTVAMLAALMASCLARGRARQVALGALAVVAVVDQLAYAAVTKDAQRRYVVVGDRWHDARPLAEVGEPLPQLFARGGMLPMSIGAPFFEHRDVAALRAAGQAEATGTYRARIVPATAGATVRFDERSVPADLRIDVTTPTPVRLVLSTAFDAGWRAEVNGRDVRPERALGAFIGIDVAPGASTIHLHHWSGWWQLAVATHVAAVIGIAVVLAMFRT